MRGSRGGGGVRVPLNNHKALGFLINTGPYPMEKLQSYQASIKWRFAGGPFSGI